MSAADLHSTTLPVDFDESTEAYYARRATTYEEIYRRPVRQPDLALIKTRLAQVFAGKRVLDVASGTGFFTSAFAPFAREVVGVDTARETLDIANQKQLPNTRFVVGNAYALDPGLGLFDAAFIGFFWSHIPHQRVAEFVDQLEVRLAAGATVVVLDNLYRAGESTPVTHIDDDGNGWQERPHPDGGTVSVLKNYPERKTMLERFARGARSTHWWRLDYYWWFEFKNKKS
jgi:demethylmenaquinone methyltransferase/2-methoxy-6-polyprenyl-1,4-benzoquinol methylase